MARVSKNRVNFSVSLPPALVQRLDIDRAAAGVTRSEAIRALLEKALAEPFPWPDLAPKRPVLTYEGRRGFSLCSGRGRRTC